MGNLLSYLKWRGDLSFTERTFNEVDNLILSELSYIDFSAVVQAMKENGSITLKEACNYIFQAAPNKKEFRVRSLSDLPPTFLEELARSVRFGNAKLFHYRDIYDENLQIQFAALHIGLQDGTVYISFRGTDQTILGWREDFNMSFQTVSSQQEAVRYLEQTLNSQTKYRIGGHSKGGNLAVYSAMMCTDILKDRIIEIYDNDGPGLSREMLQTQKYERIRKKIIRITPQFSVIGMLFEHDGPHKIVKSSADGILQHDAMTWEVEGDHFSTAQELLPKCQTINRIFDAWIENVNLEQRKIFTNNFFDALAAGGAKQLDDVANGGINGFESILTAMVGLEKDTKTVIGKLIKSTVKDLRKIDFIKLLKTKNILRGICIAILGLFFMKLPEHGVQIFGTVAVFVLLAFAVSRLIYHIAQKANWDAVNRYSTVFYIVIVGVAMLMVLQNNVLVFSTNMSLGIMFVSYGAVTLRTMGKEPYQRQKLWWMPLARALLSIVMGVVALVASDRIMKSYVFVVGTLMIIEGLREIAAEVYSIVKTLK